MELNKFLEEVKLEYPTNIVYIEYTDNPTLMIYPYDGLSYEIEIKSLHFIDTDGDPILQKCKELLLKYKRNDNLEKLLINI